MRGAKIVKEIQIKNCRSLKDTKLQRIAPITLLVGENSSGKSTFLRLFPLLKQSISKRTSGPILWAGDLDDYVDFGSFDETVTNDGSSNISLRFRFDVDSRDFIYRNILFLNESIKNNKNSEISIDYEIEISTESGRDVVSKFVLILNSVRYCFDTVQNTVKIGDDLVFTAPANQYEKKTNVSYRANFRMCVASKTFGFELPVITHLWEELSSYFEKDLSADFAMYQLREFITFVGYLLIQNKKLPSGSVKSFSNLPPWVKELYISYLKLKTTDEKSRIDTIIKLCFVYYVLPSIDEYIEEYYKQVHYIAPLRATAERYYRLRNLAIDEIDYQGKNLAIFINSLSQKQLSNFNNWTTESFGFSVFTDKSKGHLSLLIKLSNSEKAINLSDTGFGYSQVLPIITQLWELSSMPRLSRRSTMLPLVVAIEQPELHLHPAVQARLAKAFVASINLARKNGYQLQLILETHSETIVNALGRSIAKGLLASEDVSVILFDKEISGNTIVYNSHFDSDGYLLDWPYGFFDAEE